MSPGVWVWSLGLSRGSRRVLRPGWRYDVTIAVRSGAPGGTNNYMLKGSAT